MIFLTPLANLLVVLSFLIDFSENEIFIYYAFLLEINIS